MLKQKKTKNSRSISTSRYDLYSKIRQRRVFITRLHYHLMFAKQKINSTEAERRTVKRCWSIQLKRSTDSCFSWLVECYLLTVLPRLINMFSLNVRARAERIHVSVYRARLTFALVIGMPSNRLHVCIAYAASSSISFHFSIYLLACFLCFFHSILFCCCCCCSSHFIPLHYVVLFVHFQATDLKVITMQTNSIVIQMPL